MYNWELTDWANFSYDEQIIDEKVLKFTELTGMVSGILGTLETAKQQKELIGLMISEALKTSEIEGELLSREDVMSSIRNQLGLNTQIKPIRDKRAENIALLLLQVKENYTGKLTEKNIKNWHKILFYGSKYINAGHYRKGKEPMQIISGRYGNEQIHYEAPPSEQVPHEMQQFIKWYNEFKTDGNMRRIILKTAIAHLYFESIHPFEDGNGRIGRALIQKCLSESLNRPVILSVSSTIEKNKKNYYTALNKASKTLKINHWLLYFSEMLIEAQQNAIDTISLSIKKTNFFAKNKSTLNSRQLKVLKKIIDNGAEQFEGGMTAKKYMSITKTTKATATRDLQELVKLKLLIQSGDGRSTHYVLNW